MRVNHVGEVCAQALYQAQALTARTDDLRRRWTALRAKKTDHLAWTQERLAELGDRPSLLNPLWYAGAFGIGLLAGRLGDRVSLGFRGRDRTPGRAAPGRPSGPPAGG
jgi:ubiquinone biosynthesis monooxygenase Coq7